MRDALIYGIELLVGIACVAAGVAAWKRGTWLALVLVGLGVLAAGHAIWAWFLRAG